MFIIHLPLFLKGWETQTTHTYNIHVRVTAPHTMLSTFGNHCCLPEGSGTEQGDFLLHVRLDACILYHVIKYSCKKKNM